MSDIETRVDQAFATAVADQVNEQREIRRLVSRVDESLVALSDGLVDLSGQLGGTVQQLAGSAVTPEDLQRVRVDLADAIGRVDEQIGMVAQRLGDNPALEELRSLMSTTRIDLIEAMARLERGSAPVAEAVDETRREVLRALERLGQTVDSTRDAGWLEAIQRLDSVVGAFERRQLDREDAGTDALQGLRAEAEAALVALRDATEQRLVESVEHVVHQQLQAVGQDTAGRTAAQLTDDIGRTVNALAREAATDAASQSVGLAQQIAREAAQDAVAAMTAGAEALSDHAAAQVAHAAEQAALAAADRVLSALTQTGQQLHEDLSRTAGVMDATANQTAEAIQRLDQGATQAVSEVQSALRGTTASVEDRVHELAGHAAASIIDLTAETTARSEELAGLLQRLGQVTDAIDPQVRGVVDGVSGSLADLLERHQDATAQSIEQALAVMVRHNGEALEELRTAVQDAVNADTEQVTRALDTMAEVSTSVTEGVMDAVARATEQLSATHQAGATQLQAVTRDLQQLPEDVRGPVLGLLTQMQEGVAAVVADLSRASAGMSGLIEPTIRHAMDEARAALIELLDGQQDRTEASLGALAQAAGVAADDVSAAATDVRAATDGVTADVRAAADAVIARLVEAEVSSAAVLTTTLEGTVSQSAEVLHSVQAEVAAELRSAVQDLTSASERTRSSVEQSLSAVTGSLQGTLEGQLQGLLTQLAASGQDQHAQATLLRDTAQQMAEQLQASWELGSTTMQATTESARQQLIDTAEQLVARLEASGSDATTGLASRVDHASARVDDASARITQALERLDDAGASLTRQLADAGEVVASQFTVDVEAATIRLRSDLDTTLASTADRLATSGEAAAEVLSAKVTDAGERIDRAVTSIEEATQTSTSTAAEVQSTGEQMGQLLTATGEDVVGALTAALTDVTTGMSDASEGTRSQLEQLLATTTEQVQAAVTAARSELSAEIATMREATSTDAERHQRGVSRIEQTANDVVAEVAAIIERVDASIAERLGRADAEAAQTVDRMAGTGAQLRDQLAQLIEGFRHDVDRTVAGLGQEVQAQSQAVNEQLTRLGGVESEAAARMEAVVAEATDRLGAELDQTRTVLRESVTAGSDTSQVNLTAIRTEVERLLATMNARVGDLEETIATAADVTDQRSSAAMTQLQALAGDTVSEVTAQLAVVQQAIGSRLGEADLRRAEDIDRVTGVAQGMERTIESLPTEVAAVVEQVRVAMLDSTQDAQRRQTNSFTEMTTTVQALRAEVTEAVGRLSRRGSEAATGGVSLERLEGLEATLAGIEDLMAGMEGRITESVQQAIGQQVLAGDSRAQTQADGLATATEAGLAQLRAGMRADADAVLDAMAQRADEVLGGLAAQSEVVLSSLQQAEEALRSSLTEAFRQAQADGLSRLDEATSRLVALGPRLETQAQVGVRDVATEVAHEVETSLVQRVEGLRGQEDRTAEALRDLADQVAALAAREDARRSRWSQPRPRGADEGRAGDPGQTPPPPPMRDRGDVDTGIVTPRALGHVCPDCGFVAKTPPGLAAHRRTCSSGV